MANLRHPEEYIDAVSKAWREVQGQMSPAEKFELTFQLTEAAMMLIEDSVRASYPSASEREIFLRAAARRLPRHLMIRAYGWDPESDITPA